VASDLDQAGMAGSARIAPAASGSGLDARLTRIRPATRWPRLDLPELWHYHELLGIFVWRDLAVRYKQTSIGVAWAIFQPVLVALVYTIIFGRFAKFESGGVYYGVFVFAGLLPWQYFSSALATGAGCLVANVNLVTKVYFPRLLLPVAAILTPVVDFLLGLVVLLALMLWRDEWPGGPQILLAPLFMVLAAVTVLGLVLGLSAVNVRYRDVPYAIPVFMQVLPFLSGVPFTLSSLPEKWQWILALNPMTTVVAGWRWAVLDTPAPDPAQAALGVAVAIVLLLVGIAYFRSSEPRFADNI
jgi:homopolymeric O-antigen transport system permease protein